MKHISNIISLDQLTFVLVTTATTDKTFHLVLTMKKKIRQIYFNCFEIYTGSPYYNRFSKI